MNLNLYYFFKKTKQISNLLNLCKIFCSMPLMFTFNLFPIKHLFLFFFWGKKKTLLKKFKEKTYEIIDLLIFSFNNILHTNLKILKILKKN